MYLFTRGRTFRFAPDAHSGIRARYSGIDAQRSQEWNYYGSCYVEGCGTATSATATADIFFFFAFFSYLHIIIIITNPPPKLLQLDRLRRFTPRFRHGRNLTKIFLFFLLFFFLSNPTPMRHGPNRRGTLRHFIQSQSRRLESRAIFRVAWVFFGRI